MGFNVGKILGNNYVTELRSAGNNYAPKLELKQPVYNANNPKASSDFAQDCFTDGYFTKANRLDLLA